MENDAVVVRIGVVVMRIPGVRGSVNLDISPECARADTDEGVEEIRIWDDAGTYRVIYTARMADAVVVLHAFQKKMQTTSKRDLDTARERFAQLVKGRK